MSQEQMSMRIGNESAHAVYDRANRYLAELADVTGGDLIAAGSHGHLSKVFEQILHKLREQYSIGYYPTDIGKPGRRRITVKTTVPNLTIRARRYYIPALDQAKHSDK